MSTPSRGDDRRLMRPEQTTKLRRVRQEPTISTTVSNLGILTFLGFLAWLIITQQPWWAR
jgi:hypothetical protein